MSRFTVNLNDPEPAGEAEPQSKPQAAASLSKDTQPKKRGGCLRLLGILAGIAAIILIIAAIGGYIYWQSVKKTPEYSLALLVDAARRDDKAQIDQLVDSEAVVKDFMPQITGKAIELYGRNIPQQTLAKVEQAAQPVMPVIQERARAELPRVIREKTSMVEKVPYWVIALFADRAVEVTTQGDTASIKSKVPTQSLDLTMKRDGDLWKVVGMKDEVLARKIAEKIGQDIIAAAAKGGLKKAAEQLGVKDLDSLKNLDIFK